MASNGDESPRSGAGAANENPASAAFSSDKLPMNSSQNYTDDDGEEDDEGEDLFNDQFMNDFRRMGKQDQYETMEDDRDLDQIMANRRAAEIELDARQPSRSHQDTNDDEDRLPIITTGDKQPNTPTSMDDTDGIPSSPGRSQGVNFRDDVSMTDLDDDEENEEGEFKMYRVQGTLTEWVTRDDVRRFIAKKFKEFLLTYVNPKLVHGDFEYLRQINEMVAVNKCILEIDYMQFLFTHPNIGIWLADAPQSVLEVMEEVATKIVFQFHPNYSKIHQKIYEALDSMRGKIKRLEREDREIEKEMVIKSSSLQNVLESMEAFSGSSLRVYEELLERMNVLDFAS
ncbi:DNA replication licensing factor MCM2 [Striga hermonthica]|uniref:DNA replication licensing factor MCM2 n=1 Tax=Striga hermonthica TaxID=68872 RepID=A0A9N7N6N1_STRHE|nr:DNA replication licensing factor MCM2 [Striga hermonthica]